MTNFDKINVKHENKFIRHDPNMLNSVYGTTNVEPYWVADMDFEVALPIRDELFRLAQRAHFAYEFNSQNVYKVMATLTGINVAITWYLNRKTCCKCPGYLQESPCLCEN
ncbi:hypothetical protein [Thalassomonas actiniarum]|uniref:hypothetical protein n=1 Tax=Thalassomonas actiniarum TaxID=485447 RepID=UPI001F48E0FE|nr:hypothetical protein [Thalassomonas actiniarum]